MAVGVGLRGVGKNITKGRRRHVRSVIDIKTSKNFVEDIVSKKLNHLLN